MNSRRDTPHAPQTPSRQRSDFQIRYEPQTIVRTSDHREVDTGFVWLEVLDVNGACAFTSMLVPTKEVPAELGLIFQRYYEYQEACRGAKT